jgi:hypothetical protein
MALPSCLEYVPEVPIRVETFLSKQQRHSQESRGLHVHTSSYFGDALTTFRERLSGERHRQRWLAERLAFSESVISKWVNGDFETSPLTRDIVLKIGRLYSLVAEEVDVLLAGARADHQFRPSRRDQYAPLTTEERAAWVPTFGPELSTLRMWNEKIASARRSYLLGELKSAKTLAEEVLDQIVVATDTNELQALWRDDEREEMARLCIQAWWEYHMAAGSLLETPAQLLSQSSSYRARAHALAAHVHLDPVLMATIHNLDGDLYHMQEDPAATMAIQTKAQRALGKLRQCSSLDAFTQRLIVLDGLYTLPKDTLYRQIRIGREIADAITDDDGHARVMLLDAIGRTLANLHDPTCWGILDQAQQDAQRWSPVGHLSVRYSRLVALVHAPDRLDRDYVISEGKEALILARAFGWQRRVRAIQAVARGGGVRLDA